VTRLHTIKYSVQLLTFPRADSESFESALSVILSTFRRLDSVVLNAGIIGPLERVEDAKSLKEWKRCFDVNFFSLVHILQLVTNPLLESNRTGRVIFVSSGAAVGNTAAWGAYNASKAAMNSLCR
jgi:NAD(P)-dependent dehydrogenase (short-subunit alcohol dehydrogenase family)